MSFDDRPIDTGREPEVVGIDDQSAHASSVAAESEDGSKQIVQFWGA